MKYKKTVLKNGMRIITVPLSESQSAIGMVVVETGSDYEPLELNGISHFLEHMCFKGTTNRTGDTIKLEIDGMGAAANAFTSNEFTGYYAKAHKSKISKIIDFVSDIYLYPTFPQKDIDIERGVIIEEINMYQDLPQFNVLEVWQDLLYPNTPAGRPITGPKENILAFNQDEFLKYHALHYTPAKTVFIVTGNINEKEVITQLRKIFEPITETRETKRPKTSFSQKEPQISIRHKETDQTHLVLGFRSFKQYDPRNYALKVVSAILGQGFSSRLSTKMRDELGMCYYTKAGVDAYTDRGVFMVRSGVTNKRTHEAVEVIMSEFKKIRDEEIPEAELKKAKDFLIGNFSISLETSEDLADYFGFQELLREEILKPKDYIKKIKEVTAQDIKKVLKQIMKEDRLNLALIGPFQPSEAKDFKKLLRL